MSCVHSVARKMEAEGKAIGSQEAVSFVVTLGEAPAKQRRLPKGLAARREQRAAKASLTEQGIAEKQKRAEERRQVCSFTYTTHRETGQCAVSGPQ